MTNKFVTRGGGLVVSITLYRGGEQLLVVVNGLVCI